jgi:hypothetical protein
MATSDRGRHVAPHIRLAAAAFAVIAMCGLGQAATQPAQKPVSTEPVFDADLADIKPDQVQNIRDAANNAPVSRDCRSQQPKFTIVTKASDAEFARDLSELRTKAIADVLGGADRFTVEFVRGPGEDGEVKVAYEPGRDTSSPTITITPQRRQVTGGANVEFTLEATDATTRWETGIKSIQLMNVTIPGSVEPGFADSRLAGNPCDPSTMRRSWPFRYRVPRNPPALIELKGVAEDYVGNVGTETAFLTTGEFSGRYEWEYKSEINTGAAAGDRYQQTGVADFSLNVDPDGNLIGRMLGRFRIAFEGPCPSTVLSQGSFRTRMVAEYQAGRPSLTDTPHIDDVTYPRVRLCNDYRDEVDWFETNYLSLMYEAFQQLQRQYDGSMRASRPHRPEPTTKGVQSAAYTLTIRRYQK